MIINGALLYALRPIRDMLRTKEKAHGVSHGLSEVGYDIRLKQTVEYFPPDVDAFNFWLKEIDGPIVRREVAIKNATEALHGHTLVTNEDGSKTKSVGRTALASSIEEFNIPSDMWGELRNKSTHARRFYDCSLGTDMEPGWSGFLTIEIVFHGILPVTLHAGMGIAKAVFHELKHPAIYTGKYQGQADHPVPAILKTEE